MQLLSNYVKCIVKICTKLNRVVLSSLSNGATVNESYLNSKALKVKPFGFVNTTYSLKAPIKGKFNQTKQLNTTMPNLIHYLVASSIGLLYDYLDNHDAYKIYTIHSRFATAAKNVTLLVDILKTVYIKRYTKSVYFAMHISVAYMKFKCIYANLL